MIAIGNCLAHVPLLLIIGLIIAYSIGVDLYILRDNMLNSVGINVTPVTKLDKSTSNETISTLPSSSSDVVANLKTSTRSRNLRMLNINKIV